MSQNSYSSSFIHGKCSGKNSTGRVRWMESVSSRTRSFLCGVGSTTGLVGSRIGGITVLGWLGTGTSRRKVTETRGPHADDDIVEGMLCCHTSWDKRVMEYTLPCCRSWACSVMGPFLLRKCNDLVCPKLAVYIVLSGAIEPSLSLCQGMLA